MKPRVWCLLVGVLLVAEQAAAQAGRFGDFWYGSSGTAVTITSYAGPGGAVTIPAIIMGLPVTSIGGEAFVGCSGPTCITIPDSVTSIGNAAFAGCTGLTSVVIPHSVTNIEVEAFSGCTGLTSVEIGNGVTSIGEWAFRGCTGLTSVAIPKSVTSIGGSAFRDCSSLSAIEVDPANPSYSSVDGVLFDRSQTALLACPVGKKGAYIIASSVTSIGERAFAGCSGLTSIMIPSGVTSIGEWAFWGCTGLTSVIIPDSVTSIAERVFSGCSGLTSIMIPSSVTSIGEWAFWGCTGLTRGRQWGHTLTFDNLPESGEGWAMATGLRIHVVDGWHHE
jgi:hypothetical protein